VQLFVQLTEHTGVGHAHRACLGFGERSDLGVGVAEEPHDEDLPHVFFALLERLADAAKILDVSNLLAEFDGVVAVQLRREVDGVEVANAGQLAAHGVVGTSADPLWDPFGIGPVASLELRHHLDQAVLGHRVDLAALVEVPADPSARELNEEPRGDGIARAKLVGVEQQHRGDDSNSAGAAVELSAGSSDPSWRSSFVAAETEEMNTSRSRPTSWPRPFSASSSTPCTPRFGHRPSTASTRTRRDDVETNDLDAFGRSV
jgi:hypothetical protein